MLTEIDLDEMQQEFHFDYNKAQSNRFCRS